MMNRELMEKYTHLVTVFVTGAVIMVLEVLGFRLFAPYFGYTIYVWGSLIGIVMLALAVGYFTGGKLADRYGRPAILYYLIFFAGIYVLLSYYFLPRILGALIFQDIIWGSLIASLIVYGFPMFCLSMVSPFIIGIWAQSGSIGTTAGKVYALSTSGSILGTFLAAFYLIPEHGTRATVVVCFLTLLVVASWGLLFSSKKAWGLLFFALVVLIPLEQNQSTYFTGAKKLIMSTESKYGRIFLVEDEGKNIFLTSDITALTPYFFVYHSLLFKDRILSGTNWYGDFFALAPLLTPETPNFLLLGVAGGTILKQLIYFFPELKIDAVDIDEKMIEIGEKYFGLKNNKGLELHVADARSYLARSKKKFGVIGIDLYYGGGLYIPFYIASVEFYTTVRDNLKKDGLVIMNFRAATSEAKKAILNTLAKAFPSVFYLETIPIALAFPYPISEEELKDRLRQSNFIFLESRLKDLSDKRYFDLANEIVKLEALRTFVWLNLRFYQHDVSSLVLTDDFSPLDKLAYPRRRSPLMHYRMDVK